MPLVQATFKSDYVTLVTAASTAMTELLCTKQTLSEASDQHQPDLPTTSVLGTFTIDARLVQAIEPSSMSLCSSCTCIMYHQSYIASAY